MLPVQPHLFLASTSPRRAELLQQIGVPFQTQAVDIDESWLAHETLDSYVARLASAKAKAAQQTLPIGSIILAADTAGTCDNNPLIKPANETDAVAMLLSMSGKAHTVSTAISVCCDNRQETLTVSTRVVFRQITEQEARRYWATGEPADKAGSYGIQGLGAIFVERIEGSYSGIMGLPLFEVSELLQACELGAL